MSYEFYMVRINRKVPKEDYARFKNDIQLKKEAISVFTINSIWSSIFNDDKLR